MASVRIVHPFSLHFSQNDLPGTLGELTRQHWLAAAWTPDEMRDDQMHPVLIALVLKLVCILHSLYTRYSTDLQGLKPTRNSPIYCQRLGVACGGFRPVSLFHAILKKCTDSIIDSYNLLSKLKVSARRIYRKEQLYLVYPPAYDPNAN